ncbi:MOSC N-terminal beta barrel domain-containing protein, partial [Nocardioides sp.]|uniref:MOSC N-terminal beta barrel domain-containing protein n=1 Tax=Nocardioides sp. TaxID=35761 RepID=UPI00286DA9E1
MLLTGLNIHPVKSTAIRPVGSADVGLGGLDGDRTFLVVDGDGELVSAREQHSLFAITADTPMTDPSLASALRLRTADLPDLLVDVPTGGLVRAKVHSQELQGIPAGPEADAWLRAATGRDDLHLVWCDDPTRRTLNPAHSRAED